MDKQEIETYREMWLSEQIPIEDMLAIFKENSDLEEYFGIKTDQRTDETEDREL